MKSNFFKGKFFLLAVIILSLSLTINGFALGSSGVSSSNSGSVTDSSDSSADLSSIGSSLLPSSSSFISNSSSINSESLNSNEVSDSASDEVNEVEVSEEAGEPNAQSSTMMSTRASITVTTQTQLQSALANTSYDTIYLGANIDLGTTSNPVNHSVIIDGDNGSGGRYTITYAGDSNSGIGICYGANGITIHYRNVNFGFPGTPVTSHSTTNASNNYGIAPPNGMSNKTLIVENVGYYSGYGAQPFYLPGASETITFKGTNTFVMGGGSYSQEFAEGSNFIFDAGSTTTITDGNTNNLGFIWPQNNPLNFQVGAGATVNISTTHDFIYSDLNTLHNVSIGAGGTLSITQANTVSSGKLIYQTGKNLNIDAGVGSTLYIQTPIKSVFTNFTLSQAVNSEAAIVSKSDDALNASTMATFNINEASKLTLQGTTTSVAGTNATFNFGSFNNGTLGYDVSINGVSQPIVTQTNNDYWSVAGSSFSRPNSDFTTTVRNQLNNAQKIVFERKTKAVISFENEAGHLQEPGTASVGTYFADHLYWQDNGSNRNLIFKIFIAGTETQVGSDFSVTTDGDSAFESKTYTIAPMYFEEFGANYNFEIRAYKETANGYQYEETTTSERLLLNLTTSDFVVTLTTAPTALTWSNRTISETKGILTRDTNNPMTLEVLDKNENAHHWVVKALVSGTDDYSLVWKADSSTDPVDLHYQTVFTNYDVSRDGDDIYSKTWDENTGVLVNSSDYLTIGSHSNITITWTLAITP
ncbi:hypothetical protein OZX60_06815 [Streptococcaceae bacterium ESL0687]|nr:hypothetical protein OZX60_06815 [Streptococcaceae bacterium ESL0687]